MLTADLRIFVKPHIKKFVETQQAYAGHIRTKGASYYPDLRAFAMALVAEGKKDSQYDDKLGSYSEHITIKVDYDFYHKNHANVTSLVIVSFNTFADRILTNIFNERIASVRYYSDLFDQVHRSMRSRKQFYKPKASDVINDLLEEYDFTSSEIQYQTLRKRYLRAKKNSNKPVSVLSQKVALNRKK